MGKEEKICKLLFLGQSSNVSLERWVSNLEGAGCSVTAVPTEIVLPKGKSSHSATQFFINHPSGLYGEGRTDKYPAYLVIHGGSKRGIYPDLEFFLGGSGRYAPGFLRYLLYQSASLSPDKAERMRARALASSIHPDGERGLGGWNRYTQRELEEDENTSLD